MCTINNVVIRGQFNCAQKLRSRNCIYPFHSNNLHVRKDTLCLKVTKNIRFCLVENHLSSLIIQTLNEEAHIKVDSIRLEILNIHSSTTVNYNQRTLIQNFMPKLQALEEFDSIEIQQDQTDWISIPLEEAATVSALCFRLKISRNIIKFQLDKRKTKTHLSIISSELGATTRNLFTLLKKCRL